MRVIFHVVLILVGVVTTSFVHAAVKGVRVSASDENTRVVFDLERALTYEVFTLQNPARLVVDFGKATLKNNPANSVFTKTPISTMRSSVNEQHKLRVVFDLESQLHPKHFTLKDPHRLVIDLSKKKAVATTTTEAVGRSQPTATASIKSTARDVIVVIDAGHGGRDPGAIGPKGTYEKDIVLHIARKLRDAINKQPGMRAELTRTGDYYIGLRTRLDRTRKHKADMFIAVHADGFKNPRANGASVYILSERGASSEAARWLASKDRYPELSGVNLEDTGDLLRSVLIDLSQTTTRRDSLVLGQSILRELGKFARLHKKEVEKAAFAVLKAPDIPSVLVEMGFISNPEEEKKLLTRSYRQRLADAVTAGIRNYFVQNAPTGTYFATQRGRTSEHLVSSGDTLSSIAQRYNVSVAALRSANSLKKDSIRAGQALKIPT